MFTSKELCFIGSEQAVKFLIIFGEYDFPDITAALECKQVDTLYKYSKIKLSKTGTVLERPVTQIRYLACKMQLFQIETTLEDTVADLGNSFRKCYACNICAICESVT